MRIEIGKNQSTNDAICPVIFAHEDALVEDPLLPLSSNQNRLKFPSPRLVTVPEEKETI